MQRIVQSRSATLTQTLYVDGVATNPTPDSATVTIVRADGTVVVTDAAATDTGTGTFSYTLTPAQTATLDTLTATWKATFGGQLQSYVETLEVVGDHLCSLADIDARLARAGTANEYSVALKIAARDAATSAFEREACRAFTRRAKSVTLNGTGYRTLLLPDMDVASVTALSIDGTAVDVDDINITASTGELYYDYGFLAGNSTVTATYTYGLQFCPADVSNAVALIAASKLADGPFDDRGFGVTNDAGFVQLLTAGVSGAAFSIPDVQSALARWRLPIVAA